MTAHAIGIKEEPAAEEARVLRARLDFMVATLPVTVWVNPTWAAFSVIPFTGLFPIFGNLVLILSNFPLRFFGSSRTIVLMDNERNLVATTRVLNRLHIDVLWLLRFWRGCKSERQ